MRSNCRDRRPRTLVAADGLAQAVALDMLGCRRPTARNFLGHVTKPGILEALHAGVSEDAAKRMSAMKEVDMAQATEQLLTARRERLGKILAVPLVHPRNVAGFVCANPTASSLQLMHGHGLVFDRSNCVLAGPPGALAPSGPSLGSRPRQPRMD